MMQINTDTGEITNNQIPIFLTGLLPDSLSNLSWTDESLGVRHLRFLDIVQVITPEFDSETQKLSEPVYTLNDANDGIIMAYSIEQLSDDELAQKRVYAGQQRKQQITARLAEIDTLSIRPLRAVTAGTASDFDKNKLFKLDEESAQLRSELAGI
jgi:hypothetical protein